MNPLKVILTGDYREIETDSGRILVEEGKFCDCRVLVI
jgi:hypothetical protein